MGFPFGTIGVPPIAMAKGFPVRPYKISTLYVGFALQSHR
jgi:hypothetical protein